MHWIFTLKNSLKSSSKNLIHQTSSYRFFGKSINRNQLLKIDRTLTRSDYNKRRSMAAPMIYRQFNTTNVLTKGGITKISNNAAPTGLPMLAIRREDASIWERRSPLAPFHVRKLVKKGVRVLVQPSNRRAYPLQAYVNAGAFIQEDISDAPVIIGVKQVPIDNLLENKTYVFFSHTIKAQEDNMAMLDACLDRNIRLIDYEKMVNEKNQRVVAFGHYAGVAGMINILHGIGLRLLALGHHTPFMHIGPAHNYRNSGMARQAVRDCGYEIALGMMPRSIGPLTFVFTGSGNVSQGAQEIFQELPYEYVDPKDLPQVTELGSTNKVYATVVSRDDHLVRRDGQPFDAKDYEQNPEAYYSNFATNIAPFASVIINGIYWAVNSPRLLTIPDAKRLMQPAPTPWLPSSIGSPALPHRLLAICDISADPGGSIEFMTECTTIDTPFCLYDSDYNKHNNNNFSGPGVLVCSVDNMPTQLPLESTNAFGDKLFPYINDIINSDATKPFEEANFSHVVKSAVICSNGKLTPNFEYIADLRKRKSLKFNSFSEKKKNILVLGSGYVAGPLVEYFTRDTNINVNICSALQTQSEQLANSNSNCSATVLDVSSNSINQLDELISKSDLVVSLLPYGFHPLIARKCIDLKRNMLTASYVSEEMRQLDEQAKEAGITILNEIGLDPGIDHLLAMECFDQVRKNNGKITSYISFCGGLPAPENADNSLGYKFSWSPKGVLLASMNGAKYLKNNEIVQIKEGTLLDNNIEIDFLHGFNLEGYANRDSLLYKELYGISTAHTCLRGTLRYEGFCDTMKTFQLLNLISEEPHPSLHLRGPEITWRAFIANLLGQKEDILLSNLKNVLIDRLDSERRVEALEELGFLNDELINKKSTPLDTITTYLQSKLAFGPNERDIILMHHEVRIEWPNGKEEQRDINLVVYGEQNLERGSKSIDGLLNTKGFSAMAKTVGYPAAIAGQMILNGEIQKKGCIMPFDSDIYHPILKRLQQENIIASEKITKLN